jgi:hypothetical protein
VYIQGRKLILGKLYTILIQQSDATDLWGVIDAS